MYDTTQWSSSWDENLTLNVGNYSLNNNKILYEIPTYKTGSINLWQLDPIYETKLSTHSKFRLKYKTKKDLLIVYVNEESRDFILDPDEQTFSIEGDDGFLFVEYTPFNQTIRSGSIEAPYKENILPGSVKIIFHEIQMAINNMEEFLDIPPTLWRGGENNIIFDLNSIIKQKTRIIDNDIADIVTACINIKESILTKAGTFIHFQTPIENVLESKVLTQSVIETIRLYINDLETALDGLQI